MLKLAEINELSQGELVEQISKSRRELVDLRMKFASRQLEDPSQIKKKRKEIARMLTIETQRIISGVKLDEKPLEKPLKKEKKVKEEKAKETKEEQKDKEIKSVKKEKKDKKEDKKHSGKRAK